MTRLRRISPFKCRMWALHDRLGEDLTPEACRDLIDNIRKHGQQVPVLGRPVSGVPEVEVELIYGARRLFAARHLAIDLSVELREVDDQTAAILMDVENRLRKDISPYERGRSYSQWLDRGLFANQSELARSLSVSEAQVSRLLKFAALPAVIVGAFWTPRDIREEWAVALARAWADAGLRKKVADRARRCAQLKAKLSAQQLYDLLTQTDLRRAVKARAHDEVVKDDDGKPLMRVSFKAKAVHLIVQRAEITETVLTAIKTGMKEILLAASTETAVELKKRVARKTHRHGCAGGTRNASNGMRSSDAMGAFLYSLPGGSRPLRTTDDPATNGQAKNDHKANGQEPAETEHVSHSMSTDDLANGVDLPST